ncbi:MAG TPA: prolipoprotein diacylglyceryl transferase family protein [Thermoanaerobaculia bacterium]|nr:prolipoprotein diacylglyceryl transferase family protein [Thermoanaerobaculia bacterium]
MLSLHLLFEVLGYLAGLLVYVTLRKRSGDVISTADRATVFTGAALGAALGSRLLFVLSYAGGNFFGGKSIVGGLLGGLIGVEIAKKVAGITRSTGDLFVYPLITAMSIGRIGCFLAGPADKTAGLPVSWGIAMGDNVPRHPVALYEIAFLAILAVALRAVRRDGDRFRFFLGSYLAFRFAVDFLKPDPPRYLLGLSAIQWACAAGVLYYCLVLSNAGPNASLPFLRRRRVDLHDVLPQG